MKRGTIVLLFFSTAGCAAEEGNTLRIARVPAYNEDTCVPRDDRVITAGLYDPRGSLVSRPYAYMLPVQLENMAERAGAIERDGTIFEGTQAIDANDVSLMGFDACWFRVDPESPDRDVLDFGTFVGGVPDRVVCDNLPAAQKAFVPVTIHITAGMGTADAIVPLLDDTVLQGLYGVAFRPKYIAPAGFHYGTLGGVFYTYAPWIEPRDDDDWGNFPSVDLAQVIIQVRAKGKTQTGTLVESDWLTFPIDICVGCRAMPCGSLKYVECDPRTDLCSDESVCIPTCADGSLCLQYSLCADGSICGESGRCANGQTCAPEKWGLKGALDEDEGCLPFQTGEFSCATYDQCEDD